MNWLTLFVGLTMAAILLQAGILLRLYLLSRRVGGQVERSLDEARQLMPALKAITDNLKTVSENAVEIGNAARDQVHRVEEMIGDTGRTLQDQLEKVDQMSRDISDRVNETVDVVQNSIVRPVREVGAITRGLTRGLEILLSRKDRSTVDQARQDEELFI